METIWDILGLEGPTSDLKAIKRAYAQKLREVRPDEDSAGFMALREAFDSAKRMAPFMEETVSVHDGRDVFSSDEPEPDRSNTDVSEAQPWSYDIDQPHGSDPGIGNTELNTLEIESGVWPPEPPRRRNERQIETIENKPIIGEDEKLMESIRALYVNDLQHHWTEWHRLLQQKHGLSIDEYQQFEFALRHYLIGLFQDAEIEEFGEIDYHDNSALAHPPINGEVINHIVSEMGWESSSAPYEHASMDEITRLKYKSGALRRRSRVAFAQPQKEESGFPFWVIIFLVVMGINAFRLFGDQGGYNSSSYDPARMEQIREMIKAQRDSPLLDMSNPSGRSFDEIEFEQYFDLLKEGTSTADRLNRLRFENYLMRPETDISFLLNAKENGTLTKEQNAIIDSAVNRMRSRWILRRRASGSNLLDPNEELSPDMQKLLGLETNSPLQNLEETIKILEGLQVDPPNDPKND